MKISLPILLLTLIIFSSCRKDPKIDENETLYEQFVGDYKIVSLYQYYGNFWDTPLYNGVKRTFSFEGNTGTERRRIIEYIMFEDHTFETGWRDTIDKNIEVVEAEIELTRNHTYTFRIVTRSEFEGGEHVGTGKGYETYDDYTEEGVWDYLSDIEKLKFVPHSGTEINRYEVTDLESGVLEAGVVINRHNHYGKVFYSSENFVTGAEYSSTEIGKILEPYTLEFTPTENGFSVKNYRDNDGEGSYRLSELGLGRSIELWKISLDMILERQ